MVDQPQMFLAPLHTLTRRHTSGWQSLQQRASSRLHCADLFCLGCSSTMCHTVGHVASKRKQRHQLTQWNLSIVTAHADLVWWKLLQRLDSRCPATWFPIGQDATQMGVHRRCKNGLFCGKKMTTLTIVGVPPFKHLKPPCMVCVPTPKQTAPVPGWWVFHWEMVTSNSRLWVTVIW